jgi:hypothetical protein
MVSYGCTKSPHDGKEWKAWHLLGSAHGWVDDSIAAWGRNLARPGGKRLRAAESRPALRLFPRPYDDCETSVTYDWGQYVALVAHEMNDAIHGCNGAMLAG